jgi:hypothetical protein
MWDLIVVLGQSVIGQKVFQPTKVLSWWVRLHLEGVSSKLKYARNYRFCHLFPCFFAHLE